MELELSEDEVQPLEDPSPQVPYEEIDRIVGATRVGRNMWRFDVKWKGTDILTSEPFSHLLKETRQHPEIVAECEAAKQRYYDLHPDVRARDEAPSELVSAPTSQSDGRPVRRSSRLAGDPQVMVAYALPSSDSLYASTLPLVPDVPMVTSLTHFIRRVRASCSHHLTHLHEFVLF